MKDSRRGMGHTWGSLVRKWRVGKQTVCRAAIALVLAGAVVMVYLPQAASAAPAGAHHNEPTHRTYVVRHGDTLSAIALRFGITQDALMRANNIRNPNVVYVGQVLIIPGGHTPIPQPGGGHGDGGATYIVKRGDTLGDIAKRFNTTVQAIMRINRISNPNRIEVGQVLLIPGQGGKEPVHPPVHPPVQPPVVKPPSKPQQPVHPPVVHPPVVHPPVVRPPVWEPGKEPVQPPAARPPVHRPQQPPVHKPVPPVHKPEPPAQPTGHWIGSYYSGKYFDHLVEVRHDPEIRFNWYSGSPGPGIPEDRFSVRWERKEHFREGWYRFYALVDDGVRVYVDGVLIIDGWHIQPLTEYTADVYIAGGVRQLNVDYFEETDQAQIHVYYEPLGGPPPVIKR